MKKITLLCFAFVALTFNFQVSAQCTNATAFANGEAPTFPGTTIEISACNYFGEYSPITGFIIGETYELTADGGYITVIDSADGSTVLGHGPSPFSWEATVTDAQGHWNTDETCGADTACHVTTVECTSCSFPPSVPECTDTPTPANGAEDIIAIGGQTAISWVPSETGEPADVYEIFLGTESGTLTSLGTTDFTEINLTGLAYDTVYYWTIVPINSLGPAEACAEWIFTSGSGPVSPTNDLCDNAISLVCGSTLIGTTDDPAATDTGGNPAADVWYVYENLGVLEDVTVSLCGSGYDTNLRVYSDCPATDQIATNDDFCTLQSQLTFTNDGVGTYYIMVEGYNTSIGEFVITASCDVSIPAPPNDNCDASEELTIGVPSSGTTAGATDQGTGPDDDTTCDPFDFHADVWYSVTLTDGPNDLTVTTTTTGTSDEAGIAIYPNECDFLDDSSIVCGGGDDPDGASVTALNLEDGTYYIRVWSDGVAARSTSRIEGTFDIVADASLSTTDFDQVEALTYYPNPVNNNLTLNAQKDIQNITVYNVLGQEVIRSTPNTMNTEVNMSTLQSGAYFVKVTIEGFTETVKIIKN